MSTDPAGWRLDPTGKHHYRYWDGEQWTDRVTDDAIASTTRDPVSTHSGAIGTSPPEPMASASLGGAAGLPPDRAPSPQPSSTGTGRQSGRIVTKGPSARLLMALGTGGAVLIAAVVLFALRNGSGVAGDDEPPADDADEPTEEPASHVNDDLRDTMQTAARELEAAGSFAFDADIVVPLPPGAFATVDRIELEGMVSLPASMRQRGGSTHYLALGTEERVVVGDNAWRRGSAFPDSLDEVPWIAEKQLLGVIPLPDGVVQSALDSVPDPFAATLIPQWLAGATDHVDGGTDDDHRVITARIAQAAVPRPAAATRPELTDVTVELTVDHNNLPLRVALSAMIDGHQVVATYKLTAIGDPVTIKEPGPDEIDPLPTVDQHDIAAVAEEGIIPVGLTSPPGGWLLVDARVSEHSQDTTRPCAPHVDISYRGPSAAWLHISATRPTAECQFPRRGGAPFTAGDHVGTVADLGVEQGTLDIGFGPVDVADATLLDFDVDGMAVTVLAADVPDPDLARVLASLGPVDPSQQGERIGPDDGASV